MVDIDVDAYIWERTKDVAHHIMDQCPAGVKWLRNRVSEINPQVYMEIGCAKLGTFGLFESLLPNSGFAVGVDEREYEQWSSFSSLSGCDFTLIQGDSTDVATIDKVEKALTGRPIDFLFIDGNHYTSAVRSDWVNFSKLVRKGGIVAFHDYAPINLNPNDENGAGYIIEEIKKTFPQYKIEFVPRTAIGTAVVTIL